MAETGCQVPRIRSVPVAADTSGPEAAELAAEFGLFLDPWQRLVLDDALGERDDGRWAAFEVGEVVPRQNGKGSGIEARELAGLFLFGEELILHSAHEVKTAGEAFLRIDRLIGDSVYAGRVKRVNRSHGEEGIELFPTATQIMGASGRMIRRSVTQRLRFIARSRLAGRGFSGDLIILDEAFELTASAMAAMLPTLSARPNPQVWYTSTAPNQRKHKNCRVLARIRRRALAGDNRRLAYLEWSVDPEGLDDRQRRAIRADPAAWSQANPGRGLRLNDDVIAAELASLDPDDFDAERLGIGDWPVDDEGGWGLIAEDDWVSLADARSEPAGDVAFGVEVAWDRSQAWIGVGGRRGDDLRHVEIAETGLGADWVVPWLAERNRKHSPCAVVVDGGGPARSLIPALEAANLPLKVLSLRDVAAACADATDLCRPQVRGLRHRGQPALDDSVQFAQKRDLGDLWLLERRGAPGGPFMAVCLALHGHAVNGGHGEPSAWVL